ncbi:MAG: ATP-binding protein [bacterium]|nr:ATP-binding protein [bacterium]
MSLKLKILVFFLVTSLVPLLLMGWIGIYALRDNLLGRIESEELLRAEETAKDLQQVLRGHVSEARLIASLPDMATLILQAQKGPPYLGKMSPEQLAIQDRQWIDRHGDTEFGRQIAGNPLSLYLGGLRDEPDHGFGEIFVTDVRGYIIGMSGPTTDLYQADEGWWQSAWDEGRGRMMLDDRGMDISLGTVTLGVVLPVQREGKVLGILKVNYKIHDLFAQIEDPRNISAYPYLARTNGSILIGDRPGEKAFDLPIQQITARAEPLGMLSFVDSGRDYLLFFATVDQVVHQRQIHRESEQGISGEAWEPVRWIFIRVIDSRLLKDPVNETVRRFGWIGLLVLLAAAAWAFLARRLIDRPLAVLNKGVSALAEGDYSARIQDLGEPELAPVASTLNRMAERIQKEQVRLEEAVRKRTHEVHEQERLFRSLFDASFDGIVISFENRIIETNEATARLFGCKSPRELVGSSPIDVWDAESGARLIEAMRTHLDRPVAFQGHLKNGRFLAIESIGRQMEYKGMTVRAAAFRDTTERIQREEEILALNRQLTQLVDELHRSNLDLEQFAYVASHDLQEPLRAIAGFLQILVMDHQAHLDPDAQELIERTLAAANRMKAQIEDLLAYSRLNTRAKDSVALPLGEVVDEVCQMLQATITESGAQIIAGSLPVVLAERSQMVQLFQNLIGNAIKFRSERPLTIEITATELAKEVEVQIRDNGIGFEPQFAERIFEIFQRLHSRTKYEGTGIGLALCRRIVQLHGGHIGATSQPGQGTSFLFTLPKPNNP